MRFNSYIGIDYSGAASPDDPLANLQVYLADHTSSAFQVRPQTGRNWSRKTLAHWICEYIATHSRTLIGIDHGFSFPESYLQRYKLKNWDEFLHDFSRHWKTDLATVESLRQDNARTGSKTDYRLTEKWTSSAKSVFLFDVNGSVAKSTHAGLPWLLFLRKKLSDQIHFWPFDGFDVSAEKSVIVEVYPSIFRNRFERDFRTVDQQDAFSIATWFRDMDQNNFLNHYFHPPLTEKEKNTARLEGWILGVS